MPLLNACSWRKFRCLLNGEMASASGSALARRDLSSSIAPSLSDSSRRNTQQQPANSPHNVATRLPGRSALSEVDDSTYFEVLTNDILHLQQQLATLAHGTERAGRRLLSAGASYTERDLRAIAQAEEPPDPNPNPNPNPNPTPTANPNPSPNP